MKAATFFLRSFAVLAPLLCASSAFSPRHRHPAWATTEARRGSTSLSIGQLFDFLPKAENKKEPAVSPERAREIKATIKSLAAGKSNGISASDDARTEISSLVAELEGANPAAAPARSPLLDGSWFLVYTTNEGSSAGKLGPFVGGVEQLIRIEGRDAPDYINYVRLGGGAVEGALTATWDVLADDTWQVNFETVAFKALGIKLVEKELTAQGIWRMTYLDEDFRILYATGGKNVSKENIYILAK